MLYRSYQPTTKVYDSVTSKESLHYITLKILDKYVLLSTNLCGAKTVYSIYRWALEGQRKLFHCKSHLLQEGFFVSMCVVLLW